MARSKRVRIGAALGALAFTGATLLSAAPASAHHRSGPSLFCGAGGRGGSGGDGGYSRGGNGGIAFTIGGGTATARGGNGGSARGGRGGRGGSGILPICNQNTNYWYAPYWY